MNAPIMHCKDLGIGVLSVTAVILFTALVILCHLGPQPALASGQGGITGDYIVSTARLDNLTEVVFVIDSAAQEMNMYAFVPARAAIDLIQKFDLRALEVLNQPPPEAPGPGGRRNR